MLLGRAPQVPLRSALAPSGSAQRSTEHSTERSTGRSTDRSTGHSTPAAAAAGTPRDVALSALNPLCSLAALPPTGAPAIEYLLKLN